MKILVCIKQVPEFEHMEIREGAGGAVVLDAFTDYKMNRFDEFAMETAVRIKENRHGTAVDVLTVGPERSAEALKRAIGMGADHGIHLQTETTDYLSPFDIARWISTYAKPKNYDLILTGSMSEDGMNGQIGPMVAGSLGLPAATQVIHSKIEGDGSQMDIEREIEGGSREVIRLCLPTVLAIQTGANQPRYPSLSNLLRAGKQPLETLDVHELGQLQGHEVLLRYVMPPKTRAGRHLTGSAEEKAEQLLALLREKAFI